MPSVIVQRYKFNIRVRQTGESISTFVAELRALSEYCEFGNTLEEMLRDRLVCGVNEDRIQRRFLAESALDLKRALDISLGMETAAKDAHDLKGDTTNGRHPMNKLHGGMNSDAFPNNCFRCGGKHEADKCRFKTEECHKCRKIGHISRVCRSSKQRNCNEWQRKKRGTKKGRSWPEQTNNWM